MTRLNEYQLKEIKGGFLSAAMINSIARGINSLFEIGRSVGTSIRRVQTGNMCKF